MRDVSGPCSDGSNPVLNGLGALRHIAPITYERRQRKSMRPVKSPLREVSGPEIAEEDFASTLPHIARLFGV